MDLHRSTIRDRIAAAQAQTRASLAYIDEIVLRALQEAESSMDTYAAALDRLDRLEVAKDEALKVAQRTEELWRGGSVGGLVALDAQRTWILDEIAVFAAREAIYNDQITLFLALGGGWRQHLKTITSLHGSPAPPAPSHCLAVPRAKRLS